jgi:hypothetical protein
MSDDEKEVHCELHGVTVATFVCRHLQGGHGCGFHDSGSDGEDRWPDAWCDRCEATLERDGEWTDDNSPELALLCTHCYEEARRNNSRIPEPVRPGQLEVTGGEYRALAMAAHQWCTRQKVEANRRWDFEQKQCWFYDSDARVMRFYDEAGGISVLADVIVVGSFSTKSNTWAWAWGNRAYDAAAQRRVDPVRVFGEVRGIRTLAEAHWPGEEVDAWEVAQIAAYLLGAEAVYRAPYPNLYVFMLLRRFRWEN